MTDPRTPSQPDVEQAFEQAMDRMQVEMPDAPAWRKLAEDQPESYAMFRKFISYFVASLTPIQPNTEEGDVERTETFQDFAEAIDAEAWKRADALFAKMRALSIRERNLIAQTIFEALGYDPRALASLSSDTERAAIEPDMFWLKDDPEQPCVPEEWAEENFRRRDFPIMADFMAAKKCKDALFRFTVRGCDPENEDDYEIVATEIKGDELAAYRAAEKVGSLARCLHYYFRNRRDHLSQQPSNGGGE